MTLLDKNYTPELLSLESYRTAIALEASVVGKALDTLKRFLPGFNAGFKEKVTAFTGASTPPSVPLSKNQKKAFEVLRSVDYMTLSTFAVYTHEGFNGKLVEFVPVLENILADMNAVQNMVADYRVFLSAVITDRNARMSLNDTFRKYKTKARTRKELNALIAQFYKANSYNGKKKFSEVFDRNSDAETFINRINTLKIEIDKFPLGSLRGDVDQCVGMLDIFVQRLESGDIEDISNEVAQNMSEMAYLIAQEVEQVALNYHRINIFVTTANTVTETLAKINPNE